METKMKITTGNSTIEIEDPQVAIELGDRHMKRMEAMALPAPIETPHGPKEGMTAKQKILNVLRSQGPMRVRDIFTTLEGAHAGIPYASLSFNLKSLVQKKLVKFIPSSNRLENKYEAI